MGLLTRIFGNGVRIKVLEFFLENPDVLIYLTNIAQILDVSHTSVSRVISPLIGLGIIEETRLGGRIRVFKLNKKNSKAQILLNFYNSLKKESDTGVAKPGQRRETQDLIYYEPSRPVGVPGFESRPPHL